MSRVTHFEIHASKPQVLIDFYSALFGWKFKKWDPVEYWLIETGAADKPGINGGLLPRQGPAPADGIPVNSFMCTVEIGALDDTVSKATTLGGHIALAKMPIRGVGWLAYIKDPDGNIFGVMQHDPTAQ